MTTSFTNHFRFGLPDFLSGPWHNDWYTLVRKMDQVLYEVLLAQNIVEWTNSTLYVEGTIVHSSEDGLLYVCNVEHTSAASPTLFSADRVAHPTFWTGFGIGDDLNAIEAISTTGILVRTTDNVWATRTLAAPAAGFTITNPAGIIGNMTFALSDDLAALEALASTGFAARTASNTYALRTITGPAAGISVSNGDGVSGNPTLALTNDLSAVEALSATGFAVRTASDTWTVRTITVSGAGLSISNGSGVSGNPALSLADDVAAIEALSTSGFAERTGSNTWSISGFTGTGNVVRAGGSPVFSSPVTISIGTSTTQADYFTAAPTDPGVGKPSFIIKKETTANKWTILLFDSASTAGTIDVAVGTFSWNNNTVLVSGGALGTPSSGVLTNCTGYTESIVIAVGDETTAITTGTGKVTFRMPYAFTVTGIRGSLSTAQASGSILTVDVNEAGTTIISTKLTIDNTEKTSTTAATPVVISDSALADDAEITIDVDQIGDGTAKGLKVTLLGRR